MGPVTLTNSVKASSFIRVFGNIGLIKMPDYHIAFVREGWDLHRNVCWRFRSVLHLLCQVWREDPGEQHLPHHRPHHLHLCLHHLQVQPPGPPDQAGLHSHGAGPALHLRLLLQLGELLLHRRSADRRLFVRHSHRHQPRYEAGPSWQETFPYFH